MLKLGRMTDYAVVALSRLAQQAPGTVMTAPRLAAACGLPEPTVAKLLKGLSHHGLVMAQRGASGGYSLARPPEEITIAEVVTALEGPIALTACVDGSEDDCLIQGHCPIRGRWEPVNVALRQALAAVTLADLTVETHHHHTAALGE